MYHQIPPNVKAAAIGTIKIAKNIITPWIKSVQQTAKKSPYKSIKDDNESTKTKEHIHKECQKWC